MFIEVFVGLKVEIIFDVAQDLIGDYLTPLSPNDNVVLFWNDLLSLNPIWVGEWEGVVALLYLLRSLRNETCSSVNKK